MGENLKAIRIKEFNDKKASFRKWSEKFMAVSKGRGYKDVILGTVAVPRWNNNLDETNPTEKALLLAREANEVVCNNLILACNGDVVFGIVETSVSMELPNGDSKLIWKNLNAKFMPQTSANKVQLMAKFANSSLNSWRKDPDNGTKILRSRIQDCGHNIDNDTIIIHILNNLPEKYDNVVKNMERKIGASQPLTLEELQDALSLKVTKWNLRAEKNGDKEFEKDDKDEEKDETALMAGNLKDLLKANATSAVNSVIRLSSVQQDQQDQQRKPTESMDSNHASTENDSTVASGIT